MSKQKEVVIIRCTIKVYLVLGSIVGRSNLYCSRHIEESFYTSRATTSNTSRLTLQFRSNKFGDRAIRTAGPTAWNSLPVIIRQSS